MITMKQRLPFIQFVMSYMYRVSSCANFLAGSTRCALYVSSIVASSLEPCIPCNRQCNEYHQCCRNFVRRWRRRTGRKSEGLAKLEVSQKWDLLVQIGFEVVDLAVVCGVDKAPAVVSYLVM